MNLKDFKKEKLIKYIKDPLFYNGFFLFLSFLISIPLNIFFSISANKFLSVETFGIATSLLSLINWIGFFSRFGLDIGVKRFLPQTENKKSLIKTSLSLVTSSGIIFGIIFLFLVLFFIEDYQYLNNNIILILLLIIFTVSRNIMMLFDGVLISTRNSLYMAIQKIILTLLCVLFLFLMSDFGITGYFLSQLVSIIIIIISLILFLSRKIEGNRSSTSFKDIIKPITKYSLTYYYLLLISNYKLLIPTLLVALNFPEYAAYYYTVITMIRMILYATSSMTTSFMIESLYHTKELKYNFIKISIIMLFILIPIIVGGMIIGKFYLNLYGVDYLENAYPLLIYCLLTVIPVSINAIYYQICNIQEKMKNLIIFASLEAIFTLIGFLILFPLFGIEAFGISWLIINSIIAIICILEMKKYFQNKKE